MRIDEESTDVLYAFIKSSFLYTYNRIVMRGAPVN